MSANKKERKQRDRIKEAMNHEISTIIRQSCIKTVKSRGKNQIRNYLSKCCTGGKEVTMQVKEGQKVIYSKYAGTEVKLDGEEYIIVKQNDILAVVE